MNWTPDAHLAISPDGFKPFVADRVIVEYDGPRVFTFKDASGQLCLAYHCDEGEDAWRYGVVPTSFARVEKLLHGNISMFQALGQAWGWLVDVRAEGPSAAWAVPFTDWPDEYRPELDSYLVDGNAEPADEADFSVRFVGASGTQRPVKLSLIKHASDKTFAAVRELVDYSNRSNSFGLDDREAREFADFSVNKVVLASFEISVTLPKPKAADATAVSLENDVRRLIEKVVTWSAEPQLMEGEGETPEEGLAVLRAIQEITPSNRSSFAEVQLGGRMVNSIAARPKVSLRREMRPHVRSSLAAKLNKLGVKARAAIKWPDNVNATGKITGLDKKFNTFYLRDLDLVYLTYGLITTEEDDWPLGDTIFFSFDRDAWGARVNELLQTEKPISVVGRLIRQSDSSSDTLIATSVPRYQLLDMRGVES